MGTLEKDFVMAGFIPAIQVLSEVELDKKTWMPGSSPGMTETEHSSIADVIQCMMSFKKRPLTCNHLVAYYAYPWMRSSKRWPMHRGGRCWTGFTLKTDRP